MTDTVALLRRRASTDDLMLLGQLNDTTARLAYRVLNASGNVVSPDSQAEIKALELKKAELEDKMSRRSAEFRVGAQPVSLDAIQRAIPDKAALIEFAAYRPWDPKAVNERQMHESPRYVACIIRQDGAVAWRELGATTEIDSAVNALREALRDPRRK